jgi:lysophospholipase L1-like esterase
MPEVYEHLYLNADSTSFWEVSSFPPDLISICLGTNDFSEGDGSYYRAALDSSKFINDYIQFIKLIRHRYPRTQICCLSSPVFSGEKERQLTKYLLVIVQYLNQVEKDDRIHLFSFAGFYNHGCTGHPDQAEHQRMAEELLPFFKRTMNW